MCKEIKGETIKQGRKYCPRWPSRFEKEQSGISGDEKYNH